MRWIFAFLMILTFIRCDPANAKVLQFSEEEVAKRLAILASETGPAARLQVALELERNIADSATVDSRNIYSTAQIAELTLLFDQEQTFDVKLALGLVLANLQNYAKVMAPFSERENERLLSRSSVGNDTAIPFLLAVLEKRELPDFGYPSIAYGVPYPFHKSLGKHSPAHYTRTHILNALRQIHDTRITDPLIKQYRQIRNSFRNPSGAINHGEVETLMGIAYILSESDQQKAWNVLLDDLNDPRTNGLELYPGVLEKGLGLLPDGHSWSTYQRHLGVIPLTALKNRAKNSEIRQALVKALLSDWSEPIRCYAANALQFTQNEPDVRDAFEKTLREDPSKRVRSEILLSIWGGMASSSPPGFRPSSMVYIKQLSTPGDLALTIQLLEDLLAFSKNREIQNSPSSGRENERLLLRSSVDNGFGMMKEEIAAIKQLRQHTSNHRVIELISEVLSINADILLESWGKVSYRKPGSPATTEEEGEREGNKLILLRIKMIGADLTNRHFKHLRELYDKETDIDIKEAILDILNSPALP